MHHRGKVSPLEGPSCKCQSRTSLHHDGNEEVDYKKDDNCDYRDEETILVIMVAIVIVMVMVIIIIIIVIC